MIGAVSISEASQQPKRALISSEELIVLKSKHNLPLFFEMAKSSTVCMPCSRAELRIGSPRVIESRGVLCNLKIETFCPLTRSSRDPRLHFSRTNAFVASLWKGRGKWTSSNCGQQTASLLRFLGWSNFGRTIVLISFQRRSGWKGTKKDKHVSNRRKNYGKKEKQCLVGNHTVFRIVA